MQKALQAITSDLKPDNTKPIAEYRQQGNNALNRQYKGDTGNLIDKPELNCCNTWKGVIDGIAFTANDLGKQPLAKLMGKLFSSQL